MTPNTTPTDMNTASQNNPGVRLLRWANEDLEIVASDEVKQQMRKSCPKSSRQLAGCAFRCTPFVTEKAIRHQAARRAQGGGPAKWLCAAIKTMVLSTAPSTTWGQVR
jgi:hypothetical protein